MVLLPDRQQQFVIGEFVVCLAVLCVVKFGVQFAEFSV